MKRILLGGLLLCVLFPAGLYGQGMLPGLPTMPPGIGQAVDSGILSGLPAFNTGNIMWNPYAQAGFTHLGANFTLPIDGQLVIPPGGGGQLQIGALDLKLTDVDLWGGAVGVNAIVTPQISAFLMAGGAIPRLLGAPGSIPISLGPGGTEAGVEFSGTNLEVWYWQAGLGYGFGRGFSVIGGFYLDHLSVELEDPRQGSTPLANQTLRGDLIAKTYVPYLGLQLMQPSYVAIISYSPLAVADVKLSLRNSQTSLQDLRYTWNQPGDFLTFFAQYNASPPPVMVSLYFLATYLNIRGPGKLEFESVGGAAPVSQSKGSSAHMGKYSLGAGITVGTMF
jgi:hypothetical protein